MRTVNTSDRDLVRQIAQGGDSEAFSAVLAEYTDMVYSTCWRILRDETRAADVSQETFYELFKNASRVTGCLGAWLHRVATRRSIDLVRQESSRRRREQLYLAEQQSGGGSSWAEAEPLVDEALESLPDELREFVTLHFLERKTTLQIAAAKGISQPTVSRRIAEAVELVREHLRSQGAMVAVVPLQTLLLHSSHAAPEVLCRKLGKMALTQAASLGGAGKGLGLATAAKLALAASVVGVLLLTVPKPKPAPSPKTAAAATPMPKPQPTAAAKVAASTDIPKPNNPSIPTAPPPVASSVQETATAQPVAFESPIIPFLPEFFGPPASNPPSGPLPSSPAPSRNPPVVSRPTPQQGPLPGQAVGYRPQPFATYNNVPVGPFPPNRSLVPITSTRPDLGQGSASSRSRQPAIPRNL